MGTILTGEFLEGEQLTYPSARLSHLIKGPYLTPLASHLPHSVLLPRQNKMRFASFIASFLALGAAVAAPASINVDGSAMRAEEDAHIFKRDMCTKQNPPGHKQVSPISKDDIQGLISAINSLGGYDALVLPKGVHQWLNIDSSWAYTWGTGQDLYLQRLLAGKYPPEHGRGGVGCQLYCQRVLRTNWVSTPASWILDEQRHTDGDIALADKAPAEAITGCICVLCSHGLGMIATFLLSRRLTLPAILQAWHSYFRITSVR